MSEYDVDAETSDRVNFSDYDIKDILDAEKTEVDEGR